MICWTLEIEVIIAFCFAGNSAWGGAGFCWKHEVVQVFVEGKTRGPFFLCWEACGQHGEPREGQQQLHSCWTAALYAAPNGQKLEITCTHVSKIQSLHVMQLPNCIGQHHLHSTDQHLSFPSGWTAVPKRPAPNCPKLDSSSPKSCWTAATP
jgi:hypothetical protein